MNLPELKELMKQHNIRGSSYLNKPEIISTVNRERRAYSGGCRKLETSAESDEQGRKIRSVERYKNKP